MIRMLRGLNNEIVYFERLIPFISLNLAFYMVWLFFILHLHSNRKIAY